ncbi:MAG: ribonuclease R [Bacteroidia bacterium]|nr:ribonuclease R [Bacteroidia bacterium]
MTPALRTLLKECVATIFKQHGNQPLNSKQLTKIVKHNESFAPALWQNDIDDIELRDEIMKACYTLVADEIITENQPGRFKLIPETRIVEGVIEITSTGAAYVVNQLHEKDIYIAPNNTGTALNRDTVRVSLYAHRAGRRAEGEVIEIIKRFKTEFAGTLQVSSRHAFFIADGNRMNVDIFIPLQALQGAGNGDKVVVRLTHWPEDSKNPEGEVINILGKPGENNAEMDAILIEYGFPLSFPDVVEKEAAKIPFEIPAAVTKARKDFRKTTTFTIDPADAKDFDDALSFKKLKNGHYEIGIHIADVSHYLTEKMAMEKEAYERATSVYLVDRVIPMLPEKLSNHVCSLRPYEDKLCFSAVFEIDAKANVITEWYGRTVIHSIKRFTYEEAQTVIETGVGDLVDEVHTLNKLAQMMRANRFKNGAINFDRLEVKFNLDEAGNPTGVYTKQMKESNQLIEEFMLLANRSVATFIGKQHATYNTKVSVTQKQLPFVYRVHDLPDPEKVKQLLQFAGKFGYRMKANTETELAHSINKLVKEIKGKGEQNLLEVLAIRTMSKAKYSTENLGHYGLAFEYYTHFTSPIRRYPDVMVHRLLQHYLDGNKAPEIKPLEEKCVHSSAMEAQAAEAERASIKFKQVQYLQDKTGMRFNGIISGVTDWGIFVELNDSKCEGMIRLRDLNDDYYEYDEKTITLKGKRTGRKFQLGDTMQVIVKSTDLQRKQIDFIPEDMYTSGTPIRLNKTTQKPTKNGFRQMPKNKNKFGRKR